MSGEPISRPTMAAIAQEWDGIATTRMEQIDSGDDITFEKVLSPLILELAAQSDTTNVLDVGCGTGGMTHRLSKICKNVVAIDPSPESIRLAVLAHSARNIQYFQSTVERFSLDNRAKFSLVVANMSLMNVPTLSDAIRAIGRDIESGGNFIFTISHPFFWPLRLQYIKDTWFDYERDMAIRAPFNTTAQGEVLVATHFHRPLSTYINTLINHGFRVCELYEPRPEKEDVVKMGLSWDEWRRPRILAVRATSLG